MSSLRSSTRSTAIGSRDSPGRKTSVRTADTEYSILQKDPVDDFSGNLLADPFELKQPTTEALFAAETTGIESDELVSAAKDARTKTAKRPKHVPQASHIDSYASDDAISAGRPLPNTPYSDRWSQQAYTRSNDIGLVLAIDFGTTFTGVAWASTEHNTAKLNNITVLYDWTDRMTGIRKAPSVISYSPADDADQWGMSISENAVTMLNFKLELETQDKRIDELDLILQLLQGTGFLSFDIIRRAGSYPAYTSKSPAQIVTDYLSNVCDSIFNSQAFSDPKNAKLPIDICVTVPVKWSYEARNATFKALSDAGFNASRFPTMRDMIMVTEPEAAAYFTARHLQETRGGEFLKPGDVFALCDCGGGTVDLVAYQVVQVLPHLQITQVSQPTSGKCGASYIDRRFKTWLREIVGEENWRVLDASNSDNRMGTHYIENGQMRELIKKFNFYKHSFSRAVRQPMKLDLPKSLSHLTIDGYIEDGELVISPDDMKLIFNDCISDVIELIKEQIVQVEDNQNRKVKHCFLVGGFGENPYLREELGDSLKRRKIKLQRPDKDSSWTAVVQGAVIYGAEKLRQQHIKYVYACSRSYGIVMNNRYSELSMDVRDKYLDPWTKEVMGRDQFTWLIRHGELLQSNEPRIAEQHLNIKFRPKDPRVFNLPVYAHLHNDEDLPDRWQVGQYGQ